MQLALKKLSGELNTKHAAYRIASEMTIALTRHDCNQSDAFTRIALSITSGSAAAPTSAHTSPATHPATLARQQSAEGLRRVSANFCLNRDRCGQVQGRSGIRGRARREAHAMLSVVTAAERKRYKLLALI